MRQTLSVYAPVSGTLIRIDVRPGQSVQAGDLLAIIESMKMEIPVEAEVNGTVDCVLAQAADAVEEEQELLRIVA
ncbi:acetyl-CoA carboxylase biotin carboxyl carrier protein subunit [Bordetella petrii]|uniref:acetyl-CoA carboxylase biotin carboxyl carrier protein subunit n=1 Tax=Bordetella petrii TaxID=94624 RepID=UPI00047E83EE|nr:acetyl-CoA carboxylase biotin carboxyl carrier protein subunit [Bordetella petrii]